MKTIARLRRTRLRVAGAGVPLCSAVACIAIAILSGGAPAQEFYHDFRGRPLPPEFAPFGDGASTMLRVEEQGLRLTVPKDDGPRGPFGIATKFPVHGDFEITAGYQILHADEPSAGFGVGFTLFVPK